MPLGNKTYYFYMEKYQSIDNMKIGIKLDKSYQEMKKPLHERLI